MPSLNTNDLRKRKFLGDLDKNSIFYDLMKTLSPRSIGLKLQFYKGSQGVVAGVLDLAKLQNQLNDSLLKGQGKSDNFKGKQ